MSAPVATPFPLHRATAVEYLDRLPPALARRVIVRKYPADYGWSSDSPSMAALPHEFPGAGITAWQWNRQARLAVVTYPDTTFIEALALNAPTIGVWRRDLWVMRPDVQLLFDALAEVGIVHHDPASAASHTAAVYDRANAWWGTTDVQRARTMFLDRLGLSDPQWRSRWQQFLRRLVSEAG